MAAIHVHVRSVEVDRPMGRRERAELTALITRALQDRLQGGQGGAAQSRSAPSRLGPIADHVADAVSAALPATQPATPARYPRAGRYGSVPGRRR